jgi:hypothetical protein
MKKVCGWALLVLVGGFTTFASAQKTVCISAVGGGDANTFNIQEPLLKAIAKEATSRGTQVSTQLLITEGEKQTRSAMGAAKCDLAVVSNISRVWPQPKSGTGGSINPGKAKDDDDPHPSSTAEFHFILLDKSGKRMDKFDSKIEMKIRYTVRDVQPELQEIMDQMANLTVDDVSAPPQ